MRSVILLLILFVLATSCNNGEGVEGKDDALKDSSLQKIKDIEPNIWKADSVQIIYYDDPDGDSLRYSRFFTYTESNDTGKVNQLMSEFENPFTRQNNKRNCRSEGKLFLLNEQDVLKTVYFSTRGDSCSYMYFIKDGAFIYFSLSDKAKKFLNDNRRSARKPEAN